MNREGKSRCLVTPAHTHTHTHTHPHTHTHLHTTHTPHTHNVHTHAHTHTHACTHTCTRTYTHTHTFSPSRTDVLPLSHFKNSLILHLYKVFLFCFCFLHNLSLLISSENSYSYFSRWHIHEEKVNTRANATVRTSHTATFVQNTSVGLTYYESDKNVQWWVCGGKATSNKNTQNALLSLYSFNY